MNHEPTRTLRVVTELDQATGEVVQPNCPECRKRADEIAGLERDLRGWAVRYRELQRDKAVEAREHPLWPVGEIMFRAWRKRCNHPRSPWTADRFWCLEAVLMNHKYGPTLLDRVRLSARAIAGAGFDAFSTTRRNGSVKRFDEFERVFGDSGKFEEFVNRAPVGWEPKLSDELLAVTAKAEATLKNLRAVGK